MSNSGAFLSKFDEAKHPRAHGRFTSGAAIGATAGATAGALLAGALLRHRFNGFGLAARKGAAIVAHAAEATVHDVGHATSALSTPFKPAVPAKWEKLLHGAHTLEGIRVRGFDTPESRDAQALSRAYLQHVRQPRPKPRNKFTTEARHANAKRAKQKEAYVQRRAIADEIRLHRMDARGMGKLAKFLDTQHPRDAHGRFSDGPGIQRRTQHKMPSYYRLAGRVPHGQAAPDGTELPVGSFTRASLPFHKPKALSAEDRQALERGVVGVITKEREATIARGLELRRGKTLIPEGTPKRTINRAYNHASMIAVHKYGLGHYDFAMDDALKAEMAPLEPFMRYAQRRVLNTMLSEHKGGWKPYREEFGQPFKDSRTDDSGNVRLRVKPLQQLIKAAEFGALCKGAFG